MNALVVDTSSWISCFRGAELRGSTSSGFSASDLEEYLATGSIALTPIVPAELLSAPLTKRERTQLIDFLDTLALCETSSAHWVRVGELRALLNKKGVVIPPRTPTLRSVPETSAVRFSPKTLPSGSPRNMCN